MNLVQTIRDQLQPQTLAKLSSLLEVSPERLASAVEVGAPAMLAGLRGLALQDDGMPRLTKALHSLDDTMFGNFDRQLSGDTTTMRRQGSGLWNGLFGENTSDLELAVSRFSGLGDDAVRALFAFLTPLVFGRVASHWRNQGGTPAALRHLFAEQGRYIEDALPAGFSLREVAGVPHDGDAQPAAGHVPQSAEMSIKSLIKTVLPLAFLIGAGLLLWKYLDGREAPPEAEREIARDSAEEVTVLKPVAPAAAENAP